MGKEAFGEWSRRVRARNGGLPPTQLDVEAILTIHETFGEEEFRRMAREEYCGIGSGASLSSPGNTTRTQTDPTPTGDGNGGHSEDVPGSRGGERGERAAPPTQQPTGIGSKQDSEEGDRTPSTPTIQTAGAGSGSGGGLNARRAEKNGKEGTSHSSTASTFTPTRMVKREQSSEEGEEVISGRAGVDEVRSTIPLH